MNHKLLAGTHTHETPFISTGANMLLEDSKSEIYHRYFKLIKEAMKKPSLMLWVQSVLQGLAGRTRLCECIY